MSQNEEYSMVVTIDFGEGITREYHLGDEISGAVSKGEMLHMTTQHPDRSETFKAGTHPAPETFKIGESQ